MGSIVYAPVERVDAIRYRHPGGADEQFAEPTRATPDPIPIRECAVVADLAGFEVPGGITDRHGDFRDVSRDRRVDLVEGLQGHTMEECARDAVVVRGVHCQEKVMHGPAKNRVLEVDDHALVGAGEGNGTTRRWHEQHRQPPD
jgi:hypothetical protein